MIGLDIFFRDMSPEDEPILKALGIDPEQVTTLIGLMVPAEPGAEDGAVVEEVLAGAFDPLGRFTAVASCPQETVRHFGAMLGPLRGLQKELSALAAQNV